MLVPDEHAVPSATHRLLKQQPLAQVLPAQQGVPVMPQTRQDDAVDDVDDAVQRAPAWQRSMPLVPAQHCSPAPPQAEQMPPPQARPLLQVLVPQQGCPGPPQPAHLPALHRPGLVPVLPPEPVAEVLPHAVPSATHISL